MRPIGVRLPDPDVLALIERADARGGSLGDEVRAAVTNYLRGLPELFGTTEAARELLVETSNLGKIAGLPEPLYVLKAGKFYDAEAIRRLAAERRARSTSGRSSE